MDTIIYYLFKILVSKLVIFVQILNYQRWFNVDFKTFLIEVIRKGLS